MDNLNLNLNNNEKELILQQFKDKIATGADAKQLQYDVFIDVDNLCYNIIDLKKLIETFLFKKEFQLKTTNSLMINIEKDTIRYHSALKEFNKLSFNSFVHLKATYWKEKENFIKDLGFIIDFLKQFNNKINVNFCVNDLKINDFSEINDKNIKIQDGPLACYCSHVRAMIYGYLNFEDYTIIIEDDLLVANTEKIEKYIKEIPDDWDIICLNSVPLNKKYDEPVYKFINTFHSTHFYIIKNSILPFIFQNIYPIYDQIDVLIANLYDKINIYNIVETVYQKNFSTNTQNNLYVIFNSPNYKPIREYLDIIRNDLLSIINIKITDNLEEINKNITEQIIQDVIYNYIINNFNYNNSNIDDNEKSLIKKVNENNLDQEQELYKEQKLDLILLNEQLEVKDLFKNIYKNLFIFINCVVKGKNIYSETIILINEIQHIIKCFHFHNIYIKYNNNNNKKLKAYSFGSTSNTYLLEDDNDNNDKVIVKFYNNRLRWTFKNHSNICDIFNREIEILKKLKGVPGTPQLINSDIKFETKNIVMTFLGTSLYQNFNLPNDWKEQITYIFNQLSNKNIYYPEFNLKNITVINQTVNFIDYGLATFYDDNNTIINIDDISNNTNNNINLNKNNCNVFIELLEKLNNKFNEIIIDNLEDKQIQIQILYQTFIFNMKLENKYSNNIF